MWLHKIYLRNIHPLKNSSLIYKQLFYVNNSSKKFSA